MLVVGWNSQMIEDSPIDEEDWIFLMPLTVEATSSIGDVTWVWMISGGTSLQFVWMVIWGKSSLGASSSGMLRKE